MSDKEPIIDSPYWRELQEQSLRTVDGASLVREKRKTRDIEDENKPDPYDPVGQLERSRGNFAGRREEDKLQAIEEAAKTNAIRKKIANLGEEIQEQSSPKITVQEERSPKKPWITFRFVNPFKKAPDRRVGLKTKEVVDPGKQVLAKIEDKILDTISTDLKTIPKKGFSRRDFLKMLVAVPVSAFSADYHLNLGLLNYIKNSVKKVFNKNGYEIDEEALDEVEREPSSTVEEIETKKEELETINREILTYQTEGRMEYGIKQYEQKKLMYYDRYMNNDGPRSSMKKGHRKFMTWSEIKGEKGLREIFEEEFINRLAKHQEISKEQRKKYLYLYEALVIKESEGDTFAYSHAGAAGMHQFIKDTARSMGLIVKSHYDERYDPLESARAAAKFLYGLLKEYGDIRLAIHAYNGLVGRYKTWVNNLKRKGIHKEITLEGYYEWAEDRMNIILDSIRKAKMLGYRVRKNDTISGIAQRFGLNTAELMDFNSKKIRNFNELKEGQILHLPANNEIKAIYFKNKLAPFLENLNYLPAIEGIAEALEEKDEQRELGNPEKELEIKTRRSIGYDDLKEEKIIIKVKKGQSIDSLLSKYDPYNLKEKDLVPALAKLKLLQKKKKGKEYYYVAKSDNYLRVPAIFANSLKNLAGNEKRLKKLQELNPQVRNAKLPLPFGAKINT